MEKFVERTLLYDFYGELLTEVAAERGISRQGVHDMIRRCDKILSDYEEKLHLVERFLEIRTKVQEIRSSTDCPDNIKRIADEILEEL